MGTKKMPSGGAARTRGHDNYQHKARNLRFCQGSIHPAMNAIVSRFNGTDPHPTGTATVKDVLAEIQGGRYREGIEKIRATTNDKVQRQLKKDLPAVTWGCQLYYRALQENPKKPKAGPHNLISTTGLFVVDLDHLQDHRTVKQAMAADPNILFFFDSPRQGIKAALVIPGIETPAHQASAYSAVERYFKEAYSLEIDKACKNLDRLCFLSWDADLHINPDAIPFDVEAWAQPVKQQPPPEPPRQLTKALGKKKYTQKVLEGSCQRIRQSSPGNQHITRLNEARLLGGYIASGLLDEAEVITRMEQAVQDSGAKNIGAAMKTVKDGIRHGKASPLEPEVRGRQAAGKSGPSLSSAYHFTELGNAERFRDQHREYVRYVSPWKKWILYDGRRWKVVAEEQIRIYAHKTVKGLYAIAAQAEDSDMAAKIGKWAAASSRSAAITAMLKEAAALLAISPETLDADPWLFNCWNCTVDLKSGGVRPHRREDFITKISPVAFNPEAKAPIFELVLNVCLGGNQDLIDYVQRFAGYCLTGSIKEQCLNIWHGNGANGKTTIIEAISGAMGEYSQTTRPETLMVKRSDAIPSDLAKLKGARLVTAAEAEDGHRLAESSVKQMTGGEKIQARALYQDWFEYTPEFKILLCTNHKPIIRGDDHAIWRRIRLVPFSVTIPEQDRDKDLPEKLKAELPGVLNWIVTGAALWIKEGLGAPEVVEQATNIYQAEQNIIRIFLDSCCTLAPHAFVESSVLFQAFDKWRAEEGHRKINQTKFGRMLSQLGLEKERSTSTGRMIYYGVGINA